MNKYAILYGNTKSRSLEYTIIWKNNHWVGVRMVVVTAGNLVEALDKAKPRKNEVVLNSIELP